MGAPSVADVMRAVLRHSAGPGDILESQYSIISAQQYASGAAIPGPYGGMGQVQTADGNLRAPWFIPMSAPPSSVGNFSSVDTTFNGDLSHVLVAAEKRVTGSQTLGQPSGGYQIESETATFVSALYIGQTAGFQFGTGASSVGRTGIADTIRHVQHYGNGDALAFWVNAFCAGSRAGSTSWLGNPATSLFGGQNIAGANGVYLQGIGDIDLSDQALYDVAAVGCNINLVRGVATGALGADWIAYRAQNQGTQNPGGAFSLAGGWNMGVHLCAANFGTNQAAIALKQGQRLYTNAVQGGTLSLPRDVNLQTNYFTDSGTFFNFVYNNSSCLQVNNTQITTVPQLVELLSSTVTLPTNGFCITADSNTVLRLQYKGSDGTVRSTTLTIA